MQLFYRSQFGVAVAHAARQGKPGTPRGAAGVKGNIQALSQVTALNFSTHWPMLWV
jgi:hypothetical protein